MSLGTTTTASPSPRPQHGEAGFPPPPGPRVSRSLFSNVRERPRGSLVAGDLGCPRPRRHRLCAWLTRTSHISGSTSAKAGAAPPGSRSSGVGRGRGGHSRAGSA